MKKGLDLIKNHIRDITLISLFTWMAFLTAEEKMSQAVFYVLMIVLYLFGCILRSYSDRVQGVLNTVEEIEKEKTEAKERLRTIPPYNKENWDAVMGQFSEEETHNLAKSYLNRVEYEAFRFSTFINQNMPPSDASANQLDQWPLSVQGDPKTACEFAGRLAGITLLCKMRLFGIAYAYLQMKKENEHHEKESI